MQVNSVIQVHPHSSRSTLFSGINQQNAQQATTSAFQQRKPPDHQISNNQTFIFKTKTVNHENRNKETNEKQSDESHRKLYKADARKVYTGNIDRVIKWHKVVNYFCQYEVYGPIIAFHDGCIEKQKIVLLRETKGPVLQVMFYTTDNIEIDCFTAGKILRCIGIMIGPNILKAAKIREATPEEQMTLQRFSYLSDHAISTETNR